MSVTHGPPSGRDFTDIAHRMLAGTRYTQGWPCESRPGSIDPPGIRHVTYPRDCNNPDW